MSSKSAWSIEESLFILEIVIDILNLGEQFGMYFAQKSLGLDDNQERFVFYIFIAIGGASLFKAVAPNKISEFGISVLIEIGELFGYIFGLPQRTTTTLAVSLVFSTIELVLHSICISLAVKEICDQKKKKKEQSNECVGAVRVTHTPDIAADNQDKDKDCCWNVSSKLFVRFTLFAGAVFTPILTLFVDSSSRFRQVFYEILLLLTLFFSGQTYDFNTNNVSGIKTMAKETMHRIETDPDNTNSFDILKEHFKSVFTSMTTMQRWRNIVVLVIVLLLTFLILPIVWIILASLEFQDNGQNLASYDRGLYIYLLAAGSLILALIFMCFIPCGILGFVAYKCMKHLETTE